MPLNGSVSGAGFLATRDAVGLPGGNSARSVELWVNTTQSSWQIPIGYGVGGPSVGQSFGLSMSSPTSAVIEGGSSASAVFAAPIELDHPIADGQWHQLVFTYDGTTALLYADADKLIQALSNVFTYVIASTADKSA